MSKSKSNLSKLNFSGVIKHMPDEVAPLVLIFDDVQNYDVFTFRIIKILLKTFNRLCVVLIYRDTDLEIET